MKHYIIKDKDGYIALDDASGGYPYSVGENWHQAKIWTDLKQLSNYMRSFKDRQWAVYELSLSYSMVRV